MLMLKNSFVYTDFLNIYMMGFNGGGMLPIKMRDRISHPSGTQNGPFACSCTFFMLYFKLINRESGGDTDPATQRMDGSLWQPPYILYISMYKSNRPSCSCACTNLFLYISLILSYLHNGEREGWRSDLPKEGWTTMAIIRSKSYGLEGVLDHIFMHYFNAIC